MLNKRIRKKWMSTLPLVVCLGVLWQTPAFAGRSIIDFSNPSFFIYSAEDMAPRHGFILADNHRTDNQTGKTDTSRGDAEGEKSAVNNEKKTRKKSNKTKSLKTFEPTEKVKADQAVDFPYDI